MAYPLLLHGKHLGTEVTYQPFGAWLVPWRFHTDTDEYDVLRTATGLIDFSLLGALTVTGPDRVAFLQNLLTNDIKAVSPGGGCAAALVTSTAKLIADLLVLVDEDAIWLLTEATRLPAATDTLTKHHLSEQVTLTGRERTQAVLALQGPRTVETLVQITSRVISLPGAGDHIQTWFENIPVRLIRHSLAGDVGVLCLVAAEQAETAWVFLRERGRAHGLRPVGWEALNTARIEAGFPWFGQDMDETSLLPETGLEAVAVSDRKGCYLGQEVIARLATRGSVNKRLVGLLVAGAQVPAPGDRVFRGKEEVGRVTSACLSRWLERPVAMALLKRGAYEPATSVAIRHDNASLAATVTALPFVPHR